MRMPEEYHPDKVNVCKDNESISDILIMYVLKGSWEKKRNVSYIHQQHFSHISCDK